MTEDDKREQMYEAFTTARETIGETLSGYSTADPDLAGSVLVRYICISDWMLPDGQRFLMRIGSQGMTPWERDGLLSSMVGGDTLSVTGDNSGYE